jgi:hypothetical protein
MVVTYHVITGLEQSDHGEVDALLRHCYDHVVCTRGFICAAHTTPVVNSLLAAHPPHATAPPLLSTREVSAAGAARVPSPRRGQYTDSSRWIL